MRIVAGDQNTPYVISSRPSSLTKLTSGKIMSSTSELGLRITDTTTVADVFRYIEEHADEVDAKISRAYRDGVQGEIGREGSRSVKHGFLICYESSKTPAFQIITKPSSLSVASLGVVPYVQGFRGPHQYAIRYVDIEPTLYVFARAPGEGRAKWYISEALMATLPPRPPRQNSNSRPRPADLPLYPIGTVLKSWGAPNRFEEQFVRVTKHIGNSKMQARRVQTVVSDVRFHTMGNGPGHRKTEKHTFYVPSNTLVPGKASINLLPPSPAYVGIGIPHRWTSPYYKQEVQWNPTSIPIKKTEVLYSSANPKHVKAAKRIRQVLWKRVQAKAQMNALAPGGSTAQAAINRAKKTALT